MGAGGFLWLRRAPEPAQRSKSHDAPVEVGPHPEAPPPPSSQGEEAQSTPSAPTTNIQEDPASSPEKLRPHPPTARRDAQLRARSWKEQAQSAAQSGDALQLRQLLKERSDLASSSDYEDWWQAYTIIADCLDGTSDRAQELAQRFVDERRGSTMRRDVRRYCRL
jgi:hypothetical protein